MSETSRLRDRPQVERREASRGRDNGPYTAMLSRFGPDQLVFRCDDDTLVGALETVLREYETSHGEPA